MHLSGKSVADIGTGTGILALAAARAGATSVLALDINPNAARSAQENAQANGFGERVKAACMDLLTALPARPLFDVILSSPPKHAGEPRDLTDRGWHAGPLYRDVAALFQQARERLRPNGCLYVMLSSDSDLDLLGRLIKEAGLRAKLAYERLESLSVEVDEVAQISCRAGGCDESCQRFQPCFHVASAGAQIANLVATADREACKSSTLALLRNRYMDCEKPIADSNITHLSRTGSISIRAAIENRAIILVAIDEGNGAVWPYREEDVADKRSGGKLALNLGLNSVPLLLHLLKATRADFRHNLTRRNLHLKLSRVTAVAFAGSVLDVIAGERKTALTVGAACGDDKQHARASSKRIYELD